MMPTDKNCLSYWFPQIQRAGLPVPATRIVQTEIGLTDLLDGKTLEGFGDFIQEIAVAVEELGGYPFFLRTGHGSGKHEWRDTCFVSGIQDTIAQHVYRLVDWSNSVDLAGLPTRIWVVRKLLRTKPMVTLPNYGSMPLCREFRVFVENEHVLCIHFYWPFFRPWVASVIQGPDCCNKLHSFLRRLWTHSPSIASYMVNGSIPTSLANYSGITDKILLAGDFFAQLYNKFGLTPFDSEIRKQQSRYFGGFLARDIPIPQWLSIASSRWDLFRGWAAEGIVEQIHSITLNLLDLDERDECRRSEFQPLVGFSDLNAETSITIEKPSTVRQNGWLVFHGLYSTTMDECTQVVVTMFPECPISTGGGVGWRRRIQDVATLTPEEAEEIRKLASRAGAALGGSWSVDFLQDVDGKWWLVDMATAERSFHWPGCKEALDNDG